jgi:hypothetical protein
MGMQTDVLSAVATASGSMISGRTRLKGFVLTSSASAGSVVFRDGSASGTVLLTLNTPASAGFHDIVIPGEGVLFSSGVYAVLTNVTSVTIFYG